MGALGATGPREAEISDLSGDFDWTPEFFSAAAI